MIKYGVLKLTFRFSAAQVTYQNFFFGFIITFFSFHKYPRGPTSNMLGTFLGTGYIVINKGNLKSSRRGSFISFFSLYIMSISYFIKNV